MNVARFPRSLNGFWRQVSSCCFPITAPGDWPPVQGAQPPSRTGEPRGARAESPPHPPPARPYLGELGDFLAHFQVQVLAVVHAVSRLLRGGRRGRAFGGPGRRAAVIVLLPAHAWGRHLPNRPRPGHLSPRSGAVRESTASGRQEPGRPLPDSTPGAFQPQRQAPSRPRSPGRPRPGTVRPLRPEAVADTGAGHKPRVRRQQPGARPAVARFSARTRRRGRWQRGPTGPTPTG